MFKHVQRRLHIGEIVEHGAGYDVLVREMAMHPHFAGCMSDLRGESITPGAAVDSDDTQGSGSERYAVL